MDSERQWKDFMLAENELTDLVTAWWLRKSRCLVESEGSGFFQSGEMCVCVSMYVCTAYTHTDAHIYKCNFFSNRMKLAYWSSSKV